MPLIDTGVHDKPIEIFYDGTFDFIGLYREFYDWLDKNRYDPPKEKRYKDKIDEPLGNEIEVNIAATKKVTSMVKYDVAIKIVALESNWVEQAVDGKKKRMLKARLIVSITGKIIWDYDDKFAGHKQEKAVSRALKGAMKTVYVSLKKNEFLLVYANALANDCNALADKIKTILNSYA